MIVTLSSFLDVTDLEVDRIRVRERRVLRSKTTMKAHEEKEVKMIEVNEARGWTTTHIIIEFGGQQYQIMEGWRNYVSSKKSIITR